MTFKDIVKGIVNVVVNLITGTLFACLSKENKNVMVLYIHIYIVFCV